MFPQDKTYLFHLTRELSKMWFENQMFPPREALLVLEHVCTTDAQWVEMEVADNEGCKATESSGSHLEKYVKQGYKAQGKF